MSAELETLLLPVFARQARPITAAMAHKMLGAKHPKRERTCTAQTPRR